MQKVGLIGTGMMATGIAQVAAQHGYEVKLLGRSEASLQRCRERVEKALNKLVEKEKILAADAERALAHIQWIQDYADLKGSDIVIESVAEDFAIKEQIFSALTPQLTEDTIVATNTSSLSLEALASLAPYPRQFIGMHFFNPVPMMSLVEVVSGLRTCPETTAKVKDFARNLGKAPVDVKDSPGFLVNRVLFPMINEAAFALQEGVSDAAGIDECMQGGCNHPIGPLALADLVGLDVVFAILKSLQAEYGNPRYAPCLEIVKRVEAGWLGRKTGQGFYDYSR